jgi:hypothetical protein
MITEGNEILDIGDKIHSIVYKRFVQVNHPDKIESKVLESYIKGENRKNLILIHGKATTKGSIANIHHNTMVVESLEIDFRIEKGNKVLIVFNHPAYNTIFALQTMVERTNFSEYWLRYLDPRFEKRYTFQLKNEPEFHHVPLEIYNLIDNKEVQLTRQTIVDKGNQEEKIIISDTIYNGSNLRELNNKKIALNTDDFHPEYRSLLEKPSKKASLKNISLGGLCIVLDDETYENEGLVLVQVEIPPINSDDSAAVCNPLALHLFGSIRGISKTGERYGMHIAFLKRLDTHFADSHFNVAEKHYNQIKEPI